jgi:DNA-binding beta-propeller fold protein YncE
VDGAGYLYVADGIGGGRIQKRDAQGVWSLIAAQPASALDVDTGGNLYIADYDRIGKLDAQRNWSLIATKGTDGGQTVGEVFGPTALAVDGAGNLYVADYGNSGSPRIQRRDAQGTWSLVAASGRAVGQVSGPSGLAVDSANNLYVADTGNNRVQKYSPSP